MLEPERVAISPTSPGGNVLAVGVEDRELNAGQRLAGRAHPLQPLDMVLRRQRHDGAGGFGHAVHLHEAAA